MPIGLDAIPLTEPKTGVGHYTAELARALAAAAPAEEFELVYPSSFQPIAAFEEARAPEAAEAEPPGEAPPGGTATARAAASPPANLKVVRAGVGSVGRHWWSVGLPRYVRRKGLQLFHGTNYDVPLWGGCATVLTIHDLSTMLHPETHEPRRVFRLRWRLPLMARAATLVITPTESIRQEVCEHLEVSPAKVIAVPEAPRRVFAPAPAVESCAVCERFGVGADFLLAVGTLEPRKNLAALVLAFEELVRRGRAPEGLQLVIAGRRGWLNRELFARAGHWAVRDRIRFTGYVTDEELRALYTACRAFVYPSLYEGFGLPPLEAMACGAPVIASRILTLEETTGGAALLVPPSDVGALARSLEEVLEDSALAGRLSAAGVKHAAQFTWERAARLTLDVYREAMERHARGKR